MNTVHTLKHKNLKKDVKTLLKNLKINEPRGSTIFIKINLSLDKSYPATTTSPDILHEIVKNLSKTYNVLAGDSNPSACNTDKAFKITKTAEAIQSAGGTPINLSTDKKVKIENNKCKVLKNHWMPASLSNADAVMNIALLKTHVFTTITSSCKNMFGTLPGLKILHHPYLNEAIHDAVIMNTPKYNIIDGRIGMEGRGPVEGTPKKVGLLMASNHPVSIDCEAAKIMGYKPERIEHLKMINETIGGMEYKLQGPVVRKKFKPATKSPIDKIQEWTLNHPITKKICYETPLYNTFKWGAKTIKNIGRSRRIK